MIWLAYIQLLRVGHTKTIQRLVRQCLIALIFSGENFQLSVFLRILISRPGVFTGN